MLRAALLGFLAVHAHAVAVKIGIFVDREIGELGVSKEVNVARLQLEETMVQNGDDVVTSMHVIESVAPGSPADSILYQRGLAQIVQLCADGYDLVISTAPGLDQQTVSASEDAACNGVKFVQVFPTAPHTSVATVDIHWEEAYFLVGTLAGRHLSSTVRGGTCVGVLAPFPTPMITRAINGLGKGCYEANNTCEVKVAYLGTWSDEKVEARASKFIWDDVECDIIVSLSDSKGPHIEYRELGGLSFGHTVDQIFTAGEGVLTSVVVDWEPIFEYFADKVVAGTFTNETIFDGLVGDSALGFPPLVMGSYSTQTTSSDLDALSDHQDDIVAGNLEVFCGGDDYILATGVAQTYTGCWSESELLEMEGLYEHSVELIDPMQSDYGVVDATHTFFPAISSDSPLIVQVGFIFFGPLNDFGWTYAMNNGRLALEETYKGVIRTTYKDSVHEPGFGTTEEEPDEYYTQLVAKIEDMCAHGTKLVFTGSFGYMLPTISASNTPACIAEDTRFVHISGYIQTPVMSSAFGRIYQGRYLAGLVAGAAIGTTSRSSTCVTYLAAFPGIAEIYRGINAFTMGCIEANPVCNIKVLFIMTWADYKVEGDAAAYGWNVDECDILTQHSDTKKPQQYFSDQGGRSIGYNSDQRLVVSDNVLTSVIFNWAPIFAHFAEQVLDDDWQEMENYWPGYQEAAVRLADFSPLVTMETQVSVLSAKNELESGSKQVFCGEFKMSNGSVVKDILPGHFAGDCLHDGGLYEMQYLIEGANLPSFTETIYGTTLDWGMYIPPEKCPQEAEADYCTANTAVLETYFTDATCTVSELRTCSGLGTCIPPEASDGHSSAEDAVSTCDCPVADKGLYAGMEVLRGSSCEIMRQLYEFQGGMTAIIYVFGALSIIVSLGWLGFFMKYKAQKHVHANTPILAMMMCGGGVLQGVSVFLLSSHDDAGCNGSILVLAISWGLLFIPLAVKGKMIEHTSVLKKKTPFGPMRALITFVVLFVPVVIVAIAVTASGGVVARAVSLELAGVAPFHSVLLCQPAGETTAIIMYILVGLVDLISLYGMMKALNAKDAHDEFQDSKCTFFGTSGAFFFIALLHVVYLVVSSGDPATGDLLQAACIALMSITSITCYFVPKVHFALNPNENKGALMFVEASVAKSKLAEENLEKKVKDLEAKVLKLKVQAGQNGTKTADSNVGSTTGEDA